MYGLKKKYIEILKKHGCKCRNDFDNNNGWVYTTDIPVSQDAIFGVCWVCDLGRKGERPKIYKFTDYEKSDELYLVDSKIKDPHSAFYFCEYMTTKNLKDFEKKLVETLDYINDFERRRKIFKMNQKLKRIKGDFI